MAASAAESFGLEQEWCDPAHFVHPAPVASLRFHSGYAAAKGALSPYNKGLANKMGPKAVRVNMILPGFIEASGAHGMIVGLAKNKGIDEMRRARRL
jgi:NAD(P)-dependent dehydrogenase (short-subunit alcohol dehydrogenase family)